MALDGSQRGLIRYLDVGTADKDGVVGPEVVKACLFVLGGGIDGGWTD